MNFISDEKPLNVYNMETISPYNDLSITLKQKKLVAYKLFKNE